MTNRLIHETSPYLLQHAYNPVDWYPWSEEAFEKARKEDMPVLVSIGYSSCHWCHVMERESFEDPVVASFMNEHFVNIKVDREERPDVDHIYMDAVQAITGSGGWPLNVFLTPGGKPFYGGTYYPPRRVFNRSSWMEVLQAIAATYNEKKEEIEKQADGLTEHLKHSNTIGNQVDEYEFDTNNIDQAFQTILKISDKEWGGFGNAPKFPQTFTINFLLRYAYLTSNADALKQALLSLDKMIQGGIYDHVGGGFARYSTDREWLIPHFEKMLYDNALLVSSFSEAYQLTGHKKYKEVMAETLSFVERELMHEQGGFFSALDADSEGEEGKYYVWHEEEIEKLLGKDSDLFCRFYNVSDQGNWEGKNVLYTTGTLEEFAEMNKLRAEEVKTMMDKARKILLEKRNKRPRPLLDDKILLNWNALMNLAYSKAYAATGEMSYLSMAEKNMHFLLTAFSCQNQLFHSWKNDKAKQAAFLDDYAFLIAALLELVKNTGNTQWLEKARGFVEYVLENFSDPESELFFYTHKDQADVLLRKKEVYDNAVPSGNSMMAHNLYRLSIIYDRDDWRRKAGAMASAFGSIAVKHPTSFGIWLSLLTEITYGTAEIAIMGTDFSRYLKEVLQMYLPHAIILASAEETGFPLLKNKGNKGHTLIYLCKDYACQKPVHSTDELKNLLSSNFLRNNTIIA